MLVIAGLQYCLLGSFLWFNMEIHSTEFFFSFPTKLRVSIITHVLHNKGSTRLKIVSFNGFFCIKKIENEKLLYWLYQYKWLKKFKQYP